MGLIFCLYNKIGVHNITELCNRLKENDFHTINGRARTLIRLRRNREQIKELDKKRYPSSTQM